MNHLKTHIIFYLGLAQLVVGWLSTTDLNHLTLSGVALAASGLLTLVGKYVQVNLPDEPQVQIQIQPAKPPAQ